MAPVQDTPPIPTKSGHTRGWNNEIHKNGTSCWNFEFVVHYSLQPPAHNVIGTLWLHVWIITVGQHNHCSHLGLFIMSCLAWTTYVRHREQPLHSIRLAKKINSVAACQYIPSFTGLNATITYWSEVGTILLKSVGGRHFIHCCIGLNNILEDLL